ncbi:hypothetical protein [Novosphingopyxis sp. YJ-S2-01]|uniref:hypothetical protein n=1 Tax=Novosphingopyxis sp. YJ-S2-01 TaxID=2794021 RepID=UPI0018DCA98C|nr:hypothetical protein [Novosphingopyxis sp. YJ-S2-01]MBH9537595.1 hypothetical protein [Novosphingopyxis sp. YJ-S2-01]
MKKFLFAAAGLALALGGCSKEGDLDLSSGVGVNVVRSGCPIVGVPEGLGDITTFRSAGSQNFSDLDVVADITNVRGSCNESGAKIYSQVDFDVQARRYDTRQARQVTLPYFSVITQGGTAVVAKRVGEVTLNFAAGQERASAKASAAGYIDRAAATLPDDIRRQITRERKAGDADAALDPLAQPEVRAAIARATFEHLVGFQLSQDQLRYNVTR